MTTLHICPTRSPHWRETLSTGQTKDYWMCTFPCFCAGKLVSTGLFVCTQSANFVRKYLTYCFPALFVSMYILTLSNVVHSFKFVIWLWGLKLGPAPAKVFFVGKSNYFWGVTVEIPLLLYCKRSCVFSRYSKYFYGGCELC